MSDPVVGILITVAACIAVWVLTGVLFKKSSADLKHDWDAMPDTDKYALINAILPVERIVTCPNCVVVYVPVGLHGLNRETVEQKIRAIMEANPNADLAKCEAALGVKIINIDRKQSSPPTDRAYL